MVCSNREVSPYKYCQDTGFRTTLGLAGKDRPITGIFSYPNCAKSQEVLAPCLPKSAAPNDVSSVRLEFGTKDFRFNYELDRSNIERTRGENRGLFGRFFNRSPGLTGPLSPCDHGDPDSAKARMANQLGKIHPNSQDSPRILGHSMGSVDRQKESSGKENTQDVKLHNKSYSPKVSESQRATIFSRHVELRKLHGTEGSLKFSMLAEDSQPTSVSKPKETILTSQRHGIRNELVGQQLSKHITYADPSANTLFNNRCIGHCLGWKVEQCALFGSVDSRREEIALQPKRNVSHSENSAVGTLSQSTQRFITGSKRQPDCRSISEKRRRHSFDYAHEHYLPDIPASGYVSDSAACISSSRYIQYRSRSPFKASGASAVAFAVKSHVTDFSKVGNTSSRPVCVPDGACGSNLLYAGSNRQPGSILRRPEPSVELQTGMGVSAPMLDPQSSAPPEPGQGSVLNGSPQVGKSILARGFEESIPESPTYGMESERCPDRRRHGSPSTESRSNDPRGLEVWGWSRDVDNWSNEQKSLLLSSWRPSTLKTYSVAWKRWRRWAEENTIDYSAPSGSQLARYLSDLYQKEGLSYSTILVHKSVVSSLCNTSDSEVLSSHKLVRQVLKAIALQKHKDPKPPIWDVSKMISFMSSRQIRSDSLFDVSRHTAALLLLCSGRRVHDLTLLSIDSDHMFEADDCITFWPRFGSKTDSSDHRQSGWKLLSNKQCSAADPVLWIKRLIELSGQRRLSCTSQSLFITTTNVAKAASRTIIASWVKTLLNEAGIKATPGSVRAAVASKNWIQNFPLDKILEQGNWRSGDTFRLFYRREVTRSLMSQDENVNLSNLFNCS